MRELAVILLLAALVLVWALGCFLALRLSQARGRAEPGWAIMTWPVWIAAMVVIIWWRRWSWPR